MAFRCRLQRANVTRNTWQNPMSDISYEEDISFKHDKESIKKCIESFNSSFPPRSV
ncbi:unnamed protein product [Dovyalis caffra]|uniref:Uncharacterized protein n=1 Tax=Dovyalis caffra TaxID=77055 RepID=A0AAV1STG8_9ROSI|nr:unnamed protein product [Dovyalis caffra]